MEAITNVTKAPIYNSSVTHYAVWADKTELTVNGHKYVFSQPMPREVYVQLALLSEFASYLDEAPVTDLSSYVQPPGRSNFYKGKRGTKLIDSSYNAHLISMESVVSLFRELQASHKWIVIGDMVEQGVGEADQHIKLGQLLRAANFERYILVGRRTQKYTLPELDPVKTVSFLHPKDAAIYLDGRVSGSETILFKGSQYLEGIVEHLLADPAQAVTLPRQEAAAKKRRASWGLA
jgi:UDP-N-acetylmuramoyl-tripeptide--D-alanyl-D-alanine ligase